MSSQTETNWIPLPFEVEHMSANGNAKKQTKKLQKALSLWVLPFLATIKHGGATWQTITGSFSANETKWLSRVSIFGDLTIRLISNRFWILSDSQFKINFFIGQNTGHYFQSFASVYCLLNQTRNQDTQSATFAFWIHLTALMKRCKSIKKPCLCELQNKGVCSALLWALHVQ